MRSRSSPAAFLLNVSTRMRPGSMPRRSIRSATAATIVVVLPVPGPGEHQQRAALVVDHPLLRLVEGRRGGRAGASSRRTSR